jgi:glutamine---fructose-6-phosphate transaminase (isomerizing)
MCGIFGYIGKKRAREYCVKGLELLEYRGYDSAGLASIERGKLTCVKRAGKVAELKKAIEESNNEHHLAIAHTRWATHGKPTETNAHPHLNSEKSIAVVHNGIIENYKILKEEFPDIAFHSETDTEVIAHLFCKYYTGDLFEAGSKVVKELSGAYALAIVHRDHQDAIFVAAKECPLVIGRGTCETFISSDPNALFTKNLEVLYLQTGEMGIVNANGITLYDREGTPVNRLLELLDLTHGTATKNGYDHFMLKEIHEQPTTIQQTLTSRLNLEFGTANFPELNMNAKELQMIHRILILGCGTSWHAGCIGKILIEDLARISTDVEIASEFRYTNPIVSENTLVIAISQSGETADTLAALREAQAKGAKAIGICNVPNSTLTREVDSTLFLNAGPEISVCSTKAFTSQITLLTLFALYLGRLHHLSKEQGQELLTEIKRLPHQIQKVLSLENTIASVAKKYSQYTGFSFLGRRHMYPTGLEAALKLKEISYINATGYAAGEMKHGPIALAGPDLVIVAMCGNKQTFEKITSNIEEMRARDSPIIAFAPENRSEIESIADEFIPIPTDLCDELASIPYSIAGQLFAYYIAKELALDIDKPRNLAKSVTVE